MPPIRRVSDGPHTTGVPSEARQLSGIPDPNGLVLESGDEVLCVGGINDGVYIFSVSGPLQWRRWP